MSVLSEWGHLWNSLSDCLQFLADYAVVYGKLNNETQERQATLVLSASSHGVSLICLCWVTELSLLRLLSHFPARYWLAPFCHSGQIDCQSKQLVSLSSLNCLQMCCLWSRNLHTNTFKVFLAMKNKLSSL